MQDASSRTQITRNMQFAWSIVRRWSFVVLWMSVIFWFSAQPKEALDFGQSTLVGKLAHVTGVCNSGWLIQRARSGRNMQRVGWQSWLIAVLYAVTDEFHQSFTPGRTPAVMDMMIDSFGAAMGVGWRSGAVDRTQPSLFSPLSTLYALLRRLPHRIRHRP